MREMNMTDPISVMGMINGSVYFGGASPGFGIQMDVITALLSCSLFLVIVSTVVRVYRKAFWLVRIVETPHGSRFILPNAICGYLIFNGIFLSLSIPYVRLCKEWVHIGSDLSTNFLWRTLIWYPLFLAAWTLTWSTAVSPLLLATRIRNQRFDLANHPYWINSFFIGIPLVFLTSLVVLSVFAQRAYSQYWAAYQGIITYLMSVSTEATFDGTIVTNGLFQLAIFGARGLYWFELSWIFLASFGTLEMVLFAVAAHFYFGSLNQSMRTLRDQPTSSSRQRNSLSDAYRSLLATTIITLAMQFSFAVISWYLTYFVHNLVGNEAPNESVYDLGTLGPMWIFAILGLMVDSFILNRSFRNAPAPSNTTYTSRISQVKSLPSDYSQNYPPSSTKFQSNLKFERESHFRHDYSDFRVNLPQKSDLAFSNVEEDTFSRAV